MGHQKSMAGLTEWDALIMATQIVSLDEQEQCKSIDRIVEQIEASFLDSTRAWFRSVLQKVRAMTKHEQVWTKVNTQVDVGVKDLIEALGRFTQLQTIESCQNEDGRGTSWVCFQYGPDDPERPWQDLAEFVLGYLGPGLMRALGDVVGVEMRVNDFGNPIAHLFVRDGGMPETLRVLHLLAQKHVDSETPTA